VTGSNKHFMPGWKLPKSNANPLKFLKHKHEFYPHTDLPIENKLVKKTKKVK
jgi:hypothetical protein